MLSYAKIVKEMHWPEVSERKRQELAKLKKDLKKWNQKFRSPRMIKSQRDINQDESDEFDRVWVSARNPRWKLLWKSPNTMRPAPLMKREPIELDYLGDRRRKRQETMQSSEVNLEDVSSPYNDWKSLKDNEQIDHRSKAQLLREKAWAMEEFANRKSQYLKVTSDQDAEGEGVNDLLIDAIEAKLAILNDS